MEYSKLRLIVLLSVVVLWTFKTVSQSFNFALGADVSWITEMEKSGRKFYTTDGQQMEGMKVLQSLGMNTIRLRVWVNPSDGWCNKEDLLVKARRADSLGMQLMIDFHYSDWWADPGKQNKPASWVSLNFTDLKTAVSNHTKEVLNLLKSNNIYPSWVQVGNETGDGMLWDTGKASVSMSNYVQLHNAGYEAVKEVFPNSKVMVHLHNGYKNSLYRWIFDGMKTYGGKYDIIGMSLYPSWSPDSWQVTNVNCLANMNDMVSRYNKEVMIVETGMSWDKAAECKLFLTDLIQKVKTVSNGMGKGVLYWEPECYNWKSYSLGAFDLTGKPTIALDAFKTASKTEEILIDNIIQFNPDTQILYFKIPVSSCIVYNSEGKTIASQSDVNQIDFQHHPSGVYIVEGKTIENKFFKEKFKK